MNATERAAHARKTALEKAQDLADFIAAATRSRSKRKRAHMDKAMMLREEARAWRRAAIDIEPTGYFCVDSMRLWTRMNKRWSQHIALYRGRRDTIGYVLFCLLLAHECNDAARSPRSRSRS